MTVKKYTWFEMVVTFTVIAALAMVFKPTTAHAATTAECNLQTIEMVRTLAIGKAIGLTESQAVASLERGFDSNDSLTDNQRAYLSRSFRLVADTIWSTNLTTDQYVTAWRTANHCNGW